MCTQNVSDSEKKVNVPVGMKCSCAAMALIQL